MITDFLLTSLQSTDQPPVVSTLLATFRIRIPGLASVDDDTVEYWLTDAERFVDDSWMEQDHDPALIAAAAHHIQLALDKSYPFGVQKFRSGSFDAALSDRQANATGFRSTVYGLEYLSLLRRNHGGPRLVKAS